MLLLEEDLLAIMPRAKHKIPHFIDAINETLEEFEINTELRAAAFLAQIAVESGELRYTKEIWGPTKQQLKYEGRLDLGNTEPGDGFKYMGRGLIQITGRANYKACGEGLRVTLLEYPEKLEELPLCVKSAGWYWKSRGLNELADDGEIKAITKRVNGGYTHLAERTAYYDKAIETLYV